jgi:hypothetical protein
MPKEAKNRKKQRHDPLDKQIAKGDLAAEGNLRAYARKGVEGKRKASKREDQDKDDEQLEAEVSS